MKILNLYAGIGGNRKLWPKEHEVTAVEINPEIAAIYQSNFPRDEVIVEDAHNYLLEHFEEYDFIWTSPPCPTHSRIRNIAGVGCGQNKPIFPDMRLYEEIIFLQQVYNSSGTAFKGRYVVENVRSYYDPLIKPYDVGMHYFWSNFFIPPYKIESRGHMISIKELEDIKGFSSENAPFRKDTFLRNCTEPELGLHIFNAAFRQRQSVLEA